MSQEPDPPGKKARMADTVRLVVTRRERAPRSPRMERALKRLIWRYSSGQGTGQGPEKDAGPSSFSESPFVVPASVHFSGAKAPTTNLEVPLRQAAGRDGSENVQK